MNTNHEYDGPVYELQMKKKVGTKHDLIIWHATNNRAVGKLKDQWNRNLC